MNWKLAGVKREAFISRLWFKSFPQQKEIMKTKEKTLWIIYTSVVTTGIFLLYYFELIKE